MNNIMNKKYLVPAVIIAVVVAVIMVITSNPPSSKRGGKKPVSNVAVEVRQIIPQNYQIEVSSFGVVKPRTQSSLVTQASGQILSISANFREGGFFNKGEVLVQLDDRDYLAEVKIAQAGLLQAKQGLQEEQARVDQALIDWKRLGNGREPTELVLRQPQLAAAQAAMLSNQAQLDKALLALERTKIVAPFDGRILEKSVDVGRVVTTNAQLATIYATDYVEIRLPINNKDLALVDLPEQGKTAVAPVQFESDLIGVQHWQGQLDRTEGAIDNSSQQLYVVAQIDDPFSYQSHKQMPLKIGQYLTANIQGKVLTDAIVIPTKSIYQGSYVYVVQAGKLLRTEVSVLWQNSHDAVIASGLNANDDLVLTSLGQVSSGTPVAVAGMDKPNKERAQRSGDMAKADRPRKADKDTKHKEAQQ
ncbi:efflux RND transporter periplasmic adaptor subunit [Shewanella intestini]|uniref:Efflux RND transporter periplasmic adaptor subunit n=1 Tax=Shewanella intestini TaxID=2017544 RepID=A0ABS5I469_9GAMM|nr:MULTISPECIES: efflux RND transporter periplasmic adaptor subunit [Shewanella]MBR9728816.1 efflux RND transporter periplasmic adaptor subunit [Shewanella intestini]MRG36892.1 efflux RND transporter periplasmic adaptor subunit [Shewanella sp. XMDDZSB0408]